MLELMRVIQANDFNLNLIGSRRFDAVRLRMFKFFFDVFLYVLSAFSVQ